eukprot:15166902-Alexandrium_andersonii.AAC.1
MHVLRGRLQAKDSPQNCDRKLLTSAPFGDRIGGCKVLGLRIETSHALPHVARNAVAVRARSCGACCADCEHLSRGRWSWGMRPMS